MSCNFMVHTLIHFFLLELLTQSENLRSHRSHLLRLEEDPSEKESRRALCLQTTIACMNLIKILTFIDIMYIDIYIYIYIYMQH